MAKLNAKQIGEEFSRFATPEQARQLLALRETAETAVNRMIQIIDEVCGTDVESMMIGYDEVLEIDSYVGSAWKRGVVRRARSSGGKRRKTGRKR